MNFWTVPITQIMTQPVIQVVAADKVTDAALLMFSNKISAVPVIEKSGRCVGVLSGQDLIQYESIREATENEFKHGYCFNIARYGIEDAPPISKIQFDQVEYHMNRHFVVAKPNDTIAELSERMCQGHAHHAVIMDTGSKPIGIVSTLDILKCGLAVQRSGSTS